MRLKVEGDNKYNKYEEGETKSEQITQHQNKKYQKNQNAVDMENDTTNEQK